MATLTSSLIVRLIDQVSTPARAVSRSLLGLNNQMKGGFGAKLGDAITRNNQALDAARGRLFDAAAGFYALKTAIGSPIKAAMDFESAMADVRKVVDFGSEAGFEAFKNELIALSKVVPVSVNGLAQIAAAAGQAGIAGADLIKFTKAAAQIGVAFDISADEAGDAMAKLMTGLGMTIDEATLLTDAMNHLSNAQASSASEILDVVRRVGAQAKLYGFTAEQTAAFASAMISAGAESEVAATSFRNMGMALTRGSSATKRQKDAFKDLGLSATDVAKRMQEDAVGTTIDVLKRIAALPKELQGAISSDLFGNEARALGPLLTNLDLVTDSIGLVAKESDYAGSAIKEFEVRSKTFANAVEIFNNRLTALKITIGNALIPALTDLMAAISPVIDQIAAFASAHPDLTRNVVAATAALIAFKAVTATLSFVGLLGRGGALSLLSIGFNTVGKSAIGASRAVKGAVGLQTALAAMSGMKMGGLETMLVAIRGIALAVPGVSMVGSALTAIGAALAAVSLPVLGLVAAGIAAVAAAGILIWKYWDRVTSVIGGFVGKLYELSGADAVVRPTFDFLGSIGKVIGDSFGVAGQKLGEFMSWLGSFFQQEILTDEQKAAWSQVGANAAQGLVDSAKAVVMSLVEWFKGLPSMILNAIGSIDIGALIKWPTMPSWLGGGGEATPPAPTGRPNPLSGARKAGGPVWQGGSFLVGEEQPEVFTPRSSGTITPLDKTGGRQGGSGGRPVTIGQLIINEASSARDTAKAVSDELNRLARGAHSDSEAWA